MPQISAVDHLAVYSSVSCSRIGILWLCCQTTSPMASIIPVTGWQSSASAVEGGVAANTTSATSTGSVVSTQSTVSILSTMLLGVGSLFRIVLVWAQAAAPAAAALARPAWACQLDAVTTNLRVLNSAASINGIAGLTRFHAVYLWCKAFCFHPGLGPPLNRIAHPTSFHGATE